MLGIFGVIFILAGVATLAVSTTMFGQISGLILWVIAALFIVGQAVVSAIEREARGIGKALAMHAGATGQADAQPPTLREPVEKESLWQRFKKN